MKEVTRMKTKRKKIAGVLIIIVGIFELIVGIFQETVSIVLIGICFCIIGFLYFGKGENNGVGF